MATCPGCGTTEQNHKPDCPYVQDRDIRRGSTGPMDPVITMLDPPEEMSTMPSPESTGKGRETRDTGESWTSPKTDITYRRTKLIWPDLEHSDRFQGVYVWTCGECASFAIVARHDDWHAEVQKVLLMVTGIKESGQLDGADPSAEIPREDR